MTTPTTEIPAGYKADAKGRLVPENLIKPQERLEDQTVRKIIEHALELNAQIDRFLGHTFEDVATFMDILADQYDATKGGKKGNVTLTSFDGCLKVTVQVQDFLTFGPELQVAKELFDACISRWSVDANDNMKALVQHAFQVDKEGRINREALFGLRRLDINDDGWHRAVQALNDSIRVQGSKEYIRFYRRARPTDKWSAITIDLASATSPAPAAAEQAA
ncbi:MAG: sulfate transporter [Rhodospirillales bacterium CG15_BIG_FIL_POST_REV_8_21_14_020_66_15]|nr:MAG: sulfate transporter [Rhodospirillales bacterium CG15_BIG_FIL_POST_REV_8_21_14_020_66_15]